MQESNQPVVYVARELSVANGEGENYIFGYFVSKAYLRKKEIEYTPAGDINHNHIVDFNIWPAIFAIDNNVGIHAENGDGESKSKIFKDYQSCRKYVNDLNKRRLITMTSDKTPYHCARIKQKFGEVMEYAQFLEERYIPAEERRTKDYLTSALEAARELNEALGERTFDN